jgi:hypothetical protein
VNLHVSQATERTSIRLTGKKKFFDENEKFFSVYSKMTPEQKDRFFKDRKSELTSAELKRIRESETRTKATQTLGQRVEQLKADHGLSDQEFWGELQIPR